MELYMLDRNGYEFLVIPTRWLYRAGYLWPIEGIDANGDMHTIRPDDVVMSERDHALTA